MQANLCPTLGLICSESVMIRLGEVLLEFVYESAMQAQAMCSVKMKC